MLLVLFVVHHEGADECRAQMRELTTKDTKGTKRSRCRAFVLLVLFVVHHEGAGERRAGRWLVNHERHERHEKEPLSDVRAFVFIKNRRRRRQACDVSRGVG